MTTASRVLGLAIAVVATSLPGAGTVSAQGTTNPCSLLTSDEVGALAPKEEVGTGTPTASAAIDSFSCRYSWGSGTGHRTLVVSVNPVSRAFAGQNADSIKKGLMTSVVPETNDSTIPDVGETAVFKVHSPVYASAIAYVKNRILNVTLDGYDAPGMKGQLISLLKSAAGRL